MLDFLKEIVQGTPDPSAGGTVDLDTENGEGVKKRRGKGKRAAAGEARPPKRRRKKKGETEPALDDDEDAQGGSEVDQEKDA